MENLFYIFLGSQWLIFPLALLFLFIQIRIKKKMQAGEIEAKDMLKKSNDFFKDIFSCLQTMPILSFTTLTLFLYKTTRDIESLNFKIFIILFLSIITLGLIKALVSILGQSKWWVGVFAAIFEGILLNGWVYFFTSFSPFLFGVGFFGVLILDWISSWFYKKGYIKWKVNMRTGSESGRISGSSSGLGGGSSGGGGSSEKF